MRPTCKHPGGPGEILYFELQQKEVGEDRWDPEYYNPKYKPMFRDLKRRKARPLGDFIEDITYGMVGNRVLNARGTVRYMQVINVQETGIDFVLKPDRIREGSHNDPDRSRVRVGDLLLTNTSFGGMSRLLGRPVAVVQDYGMVNVSQDIDVITLKDFDCCFAAVFLKGKYGQDQLARFQHGVKSAKISFGNVKAIKIPVPSERVQKAVREQYLAMNRWHEKAMARKEELAARGRGLRTNALKKVAAADPEYQPLITEAQRRLHHVVREVERYVHGETESILPYPC